MRKVLKYIKLLYLLSLFVVSTNILKAQDSESYTILFTGNTSKGLYSENILKKWTIASENSKNTALLLLGNIYNPKENKFLDVFLPNSTLPLLLAPGEKEWANGNASGEEIIKNIENKIRKLYKGDSYMPKAACPGPKEIVLKRAIMHTKPGSIIVVHDNHKFKDKMIFTLSGFLEHFKSLNYNFKSITGDLF